MTSYEETAYQAFVNGQTVKIIALQRDENNLLFMFTNALPYFVITDKIFPANRKRYRNIRLLFHKGLAERYVEGTLLKRYFSVFSWFR